jgi:hypothetical protein
MDGFMKAPKRSVVGMLTCIVDVLTQADLKRGQCGVHAGSAQIVICV